MPATKRRRESSDEDELEQGQTPRYGRGESNELSQTVYDLSNRTFHLFEMLTMTLLIQVPTLSSS